MVVGTDTEIGKTVTCAVLISRYGVEEPVFYWKPVASGSILGTDAGAVARLCGERVRICPETFLFEAPVSPHLAASLEDREIDLQRIRDEYGRQAEGSRGRLVVEGVGGLMVPLRQDGCLLIDLLQELKLPLLLVASSRLGTINHTLLSLEAIRLRGLALAGVVLNGPPNEPNRRAIERYGAVRVIGEVAGIEPFSAPSLRSAAERFDPENVLASYLRRVTRQEDPPGAAGG